MSFSPVDSLKWPLKSALGFGLRRMRETPSVIFDIFDGSLGAVRRIDNLPAAVYTSATRSALALLPPASCRRLADMRPH
jgi:hypothetical protein